MPYRNPLPSSAARLIRASVVVGLSRKIVSRPAPASVSAKRSGLFNRQIEREHAVDARRRGSLRKGVQRPSAAAGSRS